MMGELGVYSDFPPFAHLDLRFSLSVLEASAETLAMRGLSRLNHFRDKMKTSVAGHSGAFLVERSFEIGIAEGLYFNYLDELEVDRISSLSLTQQSVDFIVYINYRYSKARKFVNLLPDRYIIRLSFSTSTVKLFQMSGLRRTEPEDLVTLIIGLINDEGHNSGLVKDMITVENLKEPQKN
jgi:hypothetical protein